MDMSLNELQELMMDRETACCSPWGRKESDTTEQMNWTELMESAILRGLRQAVGSAFSF